MQAVTNGTLADVEVDFSNKNACCVVMASDGYPLKYEKGYEITVDPEITDRVYIAGAKEENGKLFTNGGRVLGVTETADSLNEAVKKAYASAKKISFDNAFYRHDIGAKALKARAE